MESTCFPHGRGIAALENGPGAKWAAFSAATNTNVGAHERHWGQLGHQGSGGQCQMPGYPEPGTVAGLARRAVG